MKHCDPEVLALVSLGEATLSSEDATHMNTCTECRDDVQSFAAVVQGVRSQGQTQLSEPPERVWQSVRASITTENPPVSLPSASRRVAYLAAVACVVAILGGFFLGRTMSSGVSGTQVAAAKLATLPGFPASTAGQATLLENNGTYALDVETSGLPKTSGFYEVWLMGTDSGLVAVGTVSSTPGHTVLPLPVGFPVEQFPVVDISDEPFDGKPEHSSVSVLRGELSV